jgi:type IV fimbrial biogenesis protein FimT
MKNLARQTGFTLVELMITLAVIAITLSMGVPSFQEMAQGNRMTSQLNELVTDLNLARSEAIKRGRTVTFCKRNSGGTACDNAAAWATGWIVFADTDGDGTVDAGEEILRVHDALTGMDKLKFANNRVTYNASGFATGFSGTFIFCDNRGINHAKGRVLAATGRLGVPTATETGNPALWNCT